MPAPERTTTAQVVAAARTLVESGGPEALTMQAVAARVGVRAPSLYKRVRSREHLLGLVVAQALEELPVILDTTGLPDDERVVALAHAVRRFAADNPRVFALLFAPLPPAAQPSREALATASAPVLDACAALVGPERALDAARTVTAWAYGFLTMEHSGAFQLGEDTAAAYAFGAQTLARSLGRLAGS